jgi:prevent-host-death family protein
MRKTITLREANQAFARCIREVEAGEEITITRRGEPVARIVPVRRTRVLTSEQQAARARARARMEQGWHLGGERLNREELYDVILDIDGSKRRP